MRQEDAEIESSIGIFTYHYIHNLLRLRYSVVFGYDYI